MFRTTSARVKWLSGLALLVVACGVAATPASAQVRPIVTDQAALSLSSTYWFGDPNGLGVRSSNGDVAFVDEGRGALFLKRAGAPIVRLLQGGDEVPGIPNSYIDTISPPRSMRQASCACSCHYQVGTVSSSAIFTYTGSTYSLVATGGDAVPGMPGEVLGRTLTLRGFNDDGDVAFMGNLLPLGAISGDPVNTLFLAPSGGPLVRVAGAGDVATGTGGLTVVDFIVGGFNPSGEVLFSARLTNGSATTYGFFVGSIAGVRKVVAHGDAKPGGGTFDLSTSAGTAYLNSPGHVAYAESARTAIYIHTKASGFTAVVTQSTAVPASLGTRTFTQFTLSGFNTSDEVLFTGLMTGSGSNNALIRYVPERPMDVVAYKDQSVPGAVGVQLYNFVGAQMNDAGDVAFYSTQPTSSTSIGVFEKKYGDSLAAVMLNGAPSGLSGGGAWDSPTYLALGDDGVVYVETSVTGGTARAALFSNASVGYGPIVSSADALPAGARITFRNLFIGGAGDYTLFTAQYAGGPHALILHHVANATTTRVAGIGDAAPEGGIITAFTDYHLMYVNAGGTVVFGVSVSGTSGYLFAWNQATGLVQVAGTRRHRAVQRGHLHGCLPAVGRGPKPGIAGQCGGTSGVPRHLQSHRRGAVRGDAAQPLGKIVRANSVSPYGDAAPSGGQFVAITRWILNNQGQVAFQAQTRVADGTKYDGIFVGSTTPGSLQTVWICSQATSAATKATLSAFDDEGRVIFFAPDAGGLSHLYVGTGGGTPVIVAANGAAAPAGGNYAFTTASMDAEVNALGDISFQAPLSGGTADTGLFLFRRATGLVEAVAVAGQPAPDTGLLFSGLSATINAIPGEMSALGPTGEVMFVSYVEQAGVNFQVLYRYGLDKALEKIAQRGAAAADSGGGTNVNFAQGIGAGRAGLFVFRANVVGGTFKTAIYATRITPGLTWATPSAIVEGTALSGTQLNASADVPGSFVYDPPAGTVLSEGQHTLSATFTPTNATVYSGATATVLLMVTGGTGGDTAVRSDFGGDGKSDILWHHASRGEVWVWPMNGRQRDGADARADGGVSRAGRSGAWRTSTGTGRRTCCGGTA